MADVNSEALFAAIVYAFVGERNHIGVRITHRGIESSEPSTDGGGRQNALSPDCPTTQPHPLLRTPRNYLAILVATICDSRFSGEDSNAVEPPNPHSTAGLQMSAPSQHHGGCEEPLTRLRSLLNRGSKIDIAAINSDGALRMHPGKGDGVLGERSLIRPTGSSCGLTRFTRRTRLAS
ncbi:hypothetical protein ACWD4B_27470 [Streptomyces sp. NPDC002536]